MANRGIGLQKTERVQAHMYARATVTDAERAAIAAFTGTVKQCPSRPAAHILTQAIWRMSDSEFEAWKHSRRLSGLDPNEVAIAKGESPLEPTQQDDQVRPKRDRIMLHLVDNCGLTCEAAGAHFGLSRQHVANILRALRKAA